MPKDTASPPPTEEKIATAPKGGQPPLLEWEMPSRVFRKRGEDYFSKIGFTALGIGLVLIFFKEFLLLVVVLALAFVAYVLGTVPPEKIKHKITSHGVTSAGHSYLWSELKEFWLTEKEGESVLHLTTNLRFPPQLLILLDPLKKAKAEEILSEHLPHREAPQEGWLDKASNWAAGKLNLH